MGFRVLTEEELAESAPVFRELTEEELTGYTDAKPMFADTTPARGSVSGPEIGVEQPEPGLGAHLIEGTKNVANRLFGTIEGAARFYQDVDKGSQDVLGSEAYKELKDKYRARNKVSQFFEIDMDELAQVEEWAKEKHGEGVLEPVKLPQRKGIAGYFDAVAETAPQVVAQILVHLATGALGGVMFMGSQIFGGKYKNLTEKGVDSMTAFKAAVTDAALQSPLEAIGMIEALKVWKPASSGAHLFKSVLEAAGTEFVTEFLQEFPDAATEIWAEAQRDGKTDQEAVDIFLDRLGQTFVDGLKAGSVGAFLGGVTGGAGGVVQTVANRKATTQSEELISELARRRAAEVEAVRATLPGKQKFREIDEAEVERRGEFVEPQSVDEATSRVSELVKRRNSLLTEVAITNELEAGGKESHLRRGRSDEEITDAYDEIANEIDNLNDWIEKNSGEQPVDESVPEAGAPRSAMAEMGETIAEEKRKIDEQSPGTIMDELEKMLAEETDVAEGKLPPPGGLSTRQTGGRGSGVPYTEQDYQFDDMETEARYRASHGVPEESKFDKVKRYIIHAKNIVTRNFEHLPSGEKYAAIKLRLTKLLKSRTISGERVVMALQGITSELDHTRMGLFERKVYLDDLLFEAERGHKLSHGFTEESVRAELSKINDLVARDPVIQRALEKRSKFWEALRESYKKAMESIGRDVDERFNNPDYFRHQILEYAKTRGPSGSKKVRTPTGESFLKYRSGSGLDYNTDYIQAEYEVAAQMLYNIVRADVIRHVDDNYNIADQIGKDEEIPEGYVDWYPREGNILYPVTTIRESIASQLVTEQLESYGLTKEELGRAIAIGGKFKRMVIPEELAETLDSPLPERSETDPLKAVRKSIGMWKKWQLISPRRYWKYNIRNLTGDGEAVFVGNPSTFLKVPQAVSELRQVFYGDGAMTDAMRKWHSIGGFETGLTMQEMSDLNKLSRFKHVRKQTPTLNLIKKWFNFASISTQFRENILRYAAYLDYLEQIQNSPDGKPRNYGASIRDEVDALGTAEEKAFKLSNDLLGAYDEITVFGRVLRENLLPFWSFQEINMRRYWRFWKNAIDDGTLSEAVGRKVLAKGLNPMTYVRVGKFVISVSVVKAGLEVFNRTVWPDEEESLPVDIRAKPHIILGRSEKGNVQYFDRIGTLSDLLDWFPEPEDFKWWYRDWERGRADFSDLVIEMGKATTNKFFQSLRPDIKLMAELASRRAFFPDVFEPRTIRDRGYHIARSLGLENEYVALMKMPSEGYMASMKKFFIYTVNPEAGAYSHIIDTKNRFLKQLGKYGEGFHISPKGNALYNYKLALRYGDKEAENHYLKEYIRMSGTGNMKEIGRRISVSLKNAEPLHGLTKAEKVAFIATLTPEERKELIKAIHFYHTVLNPKGK